mgnify:CR=1 FL=1
MQKLFEMKGYLTKYYAKYSKIVDKAIQFVLALLTFTFINQNVGFSEIIANPIMTIVLSLICMLLPRTMIVVLATIVATIQVVTVSVGMAIVFLILWLGVVVFP